ncbi:VOC family protein [Rhodanobacter sp. L36]|uniref:VOC family protein n=1 Tax=Rhodanobacter sp. L36 TaxID=1747221 RepID=UPI00131BD498|nr:VOC family protein [Rhodanobacter sp. L36]
MASMLQTIHPVLMARDVAASIDFYRRLGFVLAFQDHPDDPRYAGVTRDGVQLHLQWADSEQWAYPVDRPVYRFVVSDVDAIHREFVESGCIDPGATHVSPWAVPANTPWGTREFHLRDPGQNGLQFYRPL